MMERRTDDNFIAELNKLLLPLWGLRAGLRTTLIEFFNKKVTVQYPDQELVWAPIFRGKHSLLLVPVTKEDICILCKQCEKICPNECIEVVIGKNDEGKRKLDDYHLDLTKCLYCGLCQEVCPVDCIVLSGGEAAFASFTREGLMFDRHGIEREASETEWAAMEAKKEAKKKPAPKPAAPVTEPKDLRIVEGVKTIDAKDIKTAKPDQTGPSAPEGEVPKE